MTASQVVIDEDLLRETDREARRAKVNRSALVRDALREHLKRRRLAEVVRREQEAYRRHPAVEFDVWDKVAAWPEE